MLFYVFLFLFTISIVLISKEKKWCRVSIVLLWAVYAFRDCVGVDDQGYINAFNRLNIGWDYYIEKTFKILVNIALHFGMNYKFVFFVYATISFIFLYKTVDLLFDDNKDIALFLATFLGYEFVSTISVMRQFAAACICSFAIIKLYRTNKIVLPIILCLCATLIHGGSIISLLAIWIIYKKLHITYSHKLIIILLCVVVGYLNILGKIIQLFSNILPWKYAYYLNSLSGQFSSAGGLVSLAMLSLFVIQCIISIRGKIIEPESDDIKILENMQLIYLGTLFIFVNSGVAARLSLTFIPFAATIPCTFIQKIKISDRKIIRIMVVFTMLVLFVKTIYETNDSVVSSFIPFKASFDFWKQI